MHYRRLALTLLSSASLISCVAWPMPVSGPTDRFQVTLTPTTQSVGTQDALSVHLKVTNTSSAVQSYPSKTCSWDDDWTVNGFAGREARACSGNMSITVTLAPGESDEHTLTVFPGALIGPVTYQLGFKPKGDTKTYWSNVEAIWVNPLQQATR